MNTTDGTAEDIIARVRKLAGLAEDVILDTDELRFCGDCQHWKRKEESRGRKWGICGVPFPFWLKLVEGRLRTKETDPGATECFCFRSKEE